MYDSRNSALALVRGLEESVVTRVERENAEWLFEPRGDFGEKMMVK